MGDGGYSFGEVAEGVGGGRYGCRHIILLKYGWLSKRRRFEAQDTEDRRTPHGASWMAAGRLGRSDAAPLRDGGYWARTKWPRRFCCQQASVLWVQKGFSLPKLTVLMRSAEMPRETRYCLTAPARRSPRARLYSVEPRSSQWPSMVTRTPGLLRRNSAVLVSASRASARMSALLKSK